MKTATTESFGLLIAYLIPGFIVLWGASHFSTDIQGWMGVEERSTESIGGFLYGTVAAVGAGLTVSTLRWLLIDPVHHWTGVKPPTWEVSNLHIHTAVLEILIESYYRFYQFYANSVVAMVFAATSHWLTGSFSWVELVLLISLSALFLSGSRNTLAKYYAQVDSILGAKGQ